MSNMMQCLWSAHHQRNSSLLVDGRRYPVDSLSMCVSSRSPFRFSLSLFVELVRDSSWRGGLGIISIHTLVYYFSTSSIAAIFLLPFVVCGSKQEKGDRHLRILIVERNRKEALYAIPERVRKRSERSSWSSDCINHFSTSVQGRVQIGRMACQLWGKLP